jgi:hypothetical protein
MMLSKLDVGSLCLFLSEKKELCALVIGSHLLEDVWQPL